MIELERHAGLQHRVQRAVDGAETALANLLQIGELAPLCDYRLRLRKHEQLAQDCFFFRRHVDGSTIGRPGTGRRVIVSEKVSKALASMRRAAEHVTQEAVHRPAHGYSGLCGGSFAEVQGDLLVGVAPIQAGETGVLLLSRQQVEGVTVGGELGWIERACSVSTDRF